MKLYGTFLLIDVELQQKQTRPISKYNCSKFTQGSQNRKKCETSHPEKQTILRRNASFLNKVVLVVIKLTVFKCCLQIIYLDYNNQANNTCDCWNDIY